MINELEFDAENSKEILAETARRKKIKILRESIKRKIESFDIIIEVLNNEVNKNK